MYQVDKKIADSLSSRNKSYIRLNADKQIDPYHITYPILWTGYLNNEKIIVKQIGQSSSHISDYEFLDYPYQYNYLKDEIVKAVDKYLRILD